MEKMLVVIFDNESKAYEGSRALRQLDDEGSIAIHAEAVIGKNADGTVVLKQSKEEFPIRAVGGTAIGSLIGLLGGPVGLAVGASAGVMAGALADINVTGVEVDYVTDVSASLVPGKCAVIADISEEWVTPVDTRMEELGGVVMRTARQRVEEDQRAREVAAIRAEIDQLKAEHARARADRKAKIQASIDKLNAKLQAKLDEAQMRSEQFRKETDAKVKALQKKAEKAHGDVKATIEARINRIREENERSQTKFKHMLASQLTAAAARLEK